MLFNSLTFAVFLAIVLPLYYLLNWRRQNVILLAASYVFYGWWDWRFLILLMLSTIVDFFVAKAMSAAADPQRRRHLMVLSVTLNLIYLGFFKYFNFFAGSLKQLLATFGLPEPDGFTLHVVLPVGNQLLYIPEHLVHRRRLSEQPGAYRRLRRFRPVPLLFPAPGRRADPAEHPALAPASWSPAHGSRPDQLGGGVDAGRVLQEDRDRDAIAPTVNRIFADPTSPAVANLLLDGVYLFALQIYCDFSGYTDIARRGQPADGDRAQDQLPPALPECQYHGILAALAHLALRLARALRLYSLGGNRTGAGGPTRNLMVTMLLGGLWHGAGWNFVIWGGLHGLYLAVHRAWAEREERECAPRATATPLGLARVRGSRLLDVPPGLF